MEARKKKHLAITPATVGNNSAAVDVSDMISATLQVSATDWTAGSYQPQVSFDGTNFVNLGSAITGSNGSVAVPDGAVAVRVHTTTAATAGPAASVGGIWLVSSY